MKPISRHRLAFYAGCLAGLSFWGSALEASGLGTAEPEQPAIELDSGRSLLLFPPGDLYPTYLAGWWHPGSAILVQNTLDAGIPDSGDWRFLLQVGGSFGLLRSEPKSGENGARWQIDLEAGLRGLFDIENSQESIAWDGNYGLSFRQAPNDRIAFKIGTLHTSGHLGDEYIERTERKRINYTREELLVGVAWNPRLPWTLYAETGWAYHLGNYELLERWRTEAGVQIEKPGSLWKARAGWYAGLDLHAMEERDWSVDFAASAGIMLSSHYRRWRLGVMYRSGRSSFGEFFQLDETSISFGLWVDL